MKGAAYMREFAYSLLQKKLPDGSLLTRQNRRVSKNGLPGLRFPPCGENATVEELREEVARLRKQLKRAELEREILKKATAYFAKESL